MTAKSATAQAGRTRTLADGRPVIAIRPPEQVMKPERLAAIQPSRISVSRAFINKAASERWNISKLSFNVAETAEGRAHYRIETPTNVFDLPVFSFKYNPTGRTGRIIGRSWDMMASLIEGKATPDDVEQISRELPKLYTGRADTRTLAWARSNRSSRAFNHTVESLARGEQPDISVVAEVCYLMRNTGLDGNGTFGTRSFRALEPDHALRNSLAAQMLGAYMMRQFATDLVNALARHASPKAAELSPEIRRFLGVGNGSALGLIFYANNHPRMLDRFLVARETSIAHAKSLQVTGQGAEVKRLLALLDRAIVFRQQDRMVYDALVPSEKVAAELAEVRALVADFAATGKVNGATAVYPLAAICEHVDGKVLPETAETLHSLLIELVPEIADGLGETLIVDEEIRTEPNMKLGRLRELLHADYGWCLKFDLTTEESRRYIWYKSATAEEPRRGPAEEVEWAHNLGLDLPRLIQELEAVLAETPADQSTAVFLMRNPKFRTLVARMQSLQDVHYHSPHMNIMAADFVPIQIVRLLNIGLHGIDKTRDFLNRNLRGVLFHGAPLPEDLRAGTHTDWFYPAEPV